MKPKCSLKWELLGNNYMLLKAGLVLSLWIESIWTFIWKPDQRIIPCGVSISQRTSLLCQVCGGQVLNRLRPDELELLRWYLSSSLMSQLPATKGTSTPIPTSPCSAVWSIKWLSNRSVPYVSHGKWQGAFEGPGAPNVYCSALRGRLRQASDSFKLFNRLLVLKYNKVEKLKQRLIVAIENCKCFRPT